MIVFQRSPDEWAPRAWSVGNPDKAEHHLTECASCEIVPRLCRRGPIDLRKTALQVSQNRGRRRLYHLELPVMQKMLAVSGKSAFLTGSAGDAL